MIHRIINSVGILRLPRYDFSRFDIIGEHFDKKIKRLAYNKPFKKQDFSDELKLVEQDYERLPILLDYVMYNSVKDYSTASLASLTYNFSKYGIINNTIFDKFYQEFDKFEGEFTPRAIYGFIYSAVKYNNEKYLRYFLYLVNKNKAIFTPSYALEMIGVLKENKTWSEQRKRQFWYTFFSASMKIIFKGKYRYNDPKKILTILKNLEYVEMYDEYIWNKLMANLKKKKGWVRVDIYEYLMKHAARFPEAKKIAEEYYKELIKNPDVVWRYNFEEKRLYTNQEMMDKSQKDIKLIPTYRTLLPVSYLPEMLVRFEQLKKTGTLLEYAQIEKDKAKSLAYVLYDKFYREKEGRTENLAAEYDKLYGMTPDEVRKLADQLELYKKNMDRDGIMNENEQDKYEYAELKYLEKEMEQYPEQPVNESYDVESSEESGSSSEESSSSDY